MRSHLARGLATNVEQDKSLPEATVISRAGASLSPWPSEVGGGKGRSANLEPGHHGSEGKWVDSKALKCKEQTPERALGANHSHALSGTRATSGPQKG